ncbi:MAG TPA: hypothetical protein VLH16_04360 [Bacteroidales bacterium]|nr:hypothetical protein [Bacteroidales bacterium]
MSYNLSAFTLAAVVMIAAGCTNPKSTTPMEQKLAKYKEVALTADLSFLSKNDRQAISLLIDAAKIMDDIFWTQAFGEEKMAFLASLPDEATINFAKINYGPWNRIDDNKPFVDGFGVKPAGANFYPADMTADEFEKWDHPEKKSLYTLIRRDDNGLLVAIPYSEAYREQHEKAADLMRRAAQLAGDEKFRKYLHARADALLSNIYQPSDYAWMEVKDSPIDFIVGPVENYEDRLFGYKAAHQAFVLVKDPKWSAKLEKFNAMLPVLQANLPVDAAYKAEVPGTDAEMNVYYAIYYAGDCNAGTKTIAINLPNDPEIHLSVGSRKLQLKNAMKAKFDEILVPIANVLICESQRKNITFNAFFENVTFHEVAHGMGIKNTINGQGQVRTALREYYSPIEEAKADIMGLYMVTKLYEIGEITSGELMDNYVTFFAGIFRSSRFGAASAHGIANMLNMKHFERTGAFIQQEDGTYSVDLAEMKVAVAAQVGNLLTIQGNGDFEAARLLVKTDGVMSERLRMNLEMVNATGIPVDIVFKQGKETLGL